MRPLTTHGNSDRAVTTREESIDQRTSHLLLEHGSIGVLKMMGFKKANLFKKDRGTNEVDMKHFCLDAFFSQQLVCLEIMLIVQGTVKTEL